MQTLLDVVVVGFEMVAAAGQHKSRFGRFGRFTRFGRFF